MLEYWELEAVHTGSHCWGFVADGDCGISWCGVTATRLDGEHVRQVAHQERGPGLLLTLALAVLWAKDRQTSSALEQVLHSGCL